MHPNNHYSDKFFQKYNNESVDVAQAKNAHCIFFSVMFSDKHLKKLRISTTLPNRY